MKAKRSVHRRLLLLAVLVSSITMLHYLTAWKEAFAHVFYRELYYLPIILGAFWYGRRGGLLTALTIAILYLPYTLMLNPSFSVRLFGNLLEVVLFPTIGGLLGWLRDREAVRQQELRRAESLAAMGQSVAAIAHDLKAPLTIIGGLADQLCRKLPADDPAAEKMKVIHQQSARLEVLVRDMLAFARPLQLDLKKDNITRLVAETVAAVEAIARKRAVAVKMQMEDDLLWADFDWSRLQQALLNLINNAVEASPAGETVIVRALGRRDEIAVEIIDRGDGILPERREDIFKPFVMTKKSGTGLGLPIVRKIVEAHGGGVSVVSTRERGATFRMTLPQRH